MNKLARPLFQTLCASLIIIGFWQAIVTLGDLPHFILPGPQKVAYTLWVSRELIFLHSITTLYEIVLGLLLGTLFGAITAIGLAVSPIARYLIRPVLIITQALPVFAIAPLLTLWAGYGTGSKILMAVLIIYFPVVSNFFDGLMQTPKGWLHLAQVMDAKPTNILLRIRIPAAIPAFASGLRLAAIYAPIGAVIGEWVGASSGLGYLMLLANGRAKIDLMFAALFVLALITLLLHLIIGKLCDYLTDRYYPTGRQIT